MSCAAGEGDGSRSGRDADPTSYRWLCARGTLGAVGDLSAITEAMRRFSDDRGWSQFHDPKSLVLALVGEVGEVAELVQWLPAENATKALRTAPLSDAMSSELADVLLYLVRLADVLGVDLAGAALHKLASNQLRFPVEQVFGAAPDRSRSGAGDRHPGHPVDQRSHEGPR